MPRTLTKSRFRLAQECPTKLFYTGKESVYPNRKSEDSFLAALADGGFQVGELAKLYHPGGIEVEGLDYAQVLAKTAEWLERDEVTLFEPAFEYEGLFIRVDVLVKRERQIDLIEVKAKSCDGSDTRQFLNENGGVRSKWRPYLEDVAFQKYVIERALPSSTVRAHLMLCDKQTVCPTDGLHQKLLLEKDERGRRRVRVTKPLSSEEERQPVLTIIDANEIACGILEAKNFGLEGNSSFREWVEHLVGEYAADRRIDSPLGSKCKKCEFRADPGEKAHGLRSGFEECLVRELNWSGEELEQPTVLDLANFQGANRLLAQGCVRLLDVTQADLRYDGRRGDTLSNKERQWLQVDRVQRGSSAMELRRDALKREMDRWTFPLHFIDFETATPAVPFHRGLRPYATLAFQFSHHVVHEDGRVEHRGEHLDTGTGVFPSYEFLRALRKELEGDEGTIFRYAPHENTVLAALHGQLAAEADPIPDREELQRFIESIATPTESCGGTWPVPPRNMVDMCRIVKETYFDPATRGSSSIKKVLPAVLNGSQVVREKYSEPIYGAPGGIPSLNFVSEAWVQLDEEGRVRDPYELLPPLFRDAEPHELEELLSEEGELREGGAAMTAYARMQYTEMGEYERETLRKALLKYCELDTLAMVMIYEAWRGWTG